MLSKTDIRRNAILDRLLKSEEPISAKVFAIDFHVSRQSIVQDIAVLKAAGNNIISTNRGYFIQPSRVVSREFKVFHQDEEVEEELTTIVDLGGRVKNVSISHRIYGRITANLRISSRNDVKNFIQKIDGSSSRLLGNATMGYHYHQIEADNEEILDAIEKKLEEEGFLAPYLEGEREEIW